MTTDGNRSSKAASARPLATSVLAATLLSFTLFAQSAAADGVCPSEWELDVVDLINVERGRVQAPPLEVDVRLVASARRHSEDMADGRFLSHTGSDGSSPAQRMSEAGYPVPGGETAGAGHTSPQMIVTGWMNSTAHRNILLDPRYVHVGVGWASDGQPVASMWSNLWTANFGRSTAPPHTVEQFCGDSAAFDCSDGLDNDGDGSVDAQDVGCMTPDDPSEKPACDDGIDNDGDGKTDLADSFCSDPGGGLEGPLCLDGLDNDGDGLADWPADPDCAGPDQWSESNAACGFGFELAFLLPPLMAWRTRRRARR